LLAPPCSVLHSCFIVCKLIVNRILIPSPLKHHSKKHNQSVSPVAGLLASVQSAQR
jgi:hypothetical protein